MRLFYFLEHFLMTKSFGLDRSFLFGKYSDTTALLTFLIWRRTEGQSFEGYSFSGRSPDKYAFRAFVRGLGLLLGSEDVELRAAKLRS